VVPGPDGLIERERVTELTHAPEILAHDAVIAGANQHVKRHGAVTKALEIRDVLRIDAMVAGTNDIVR
jgi:hypothetical protein